MRFHISRFLLTLLTLLVSFSPVGARADDNQVFERIIKSGTIRCAYYTWPPFLSKDPNTGEMKGIGYDLMNEVAKQLDLKLEWVAEVGMDAMFEGYASGRYDMMCGPIAATPARTRVSDFTIPVFYGSYYLYSRQGDARFDGRFEKINDQSIKYASLEGDMNAILGRELFPQSVKIDLPQTASSTDLLLQVSTGKADVTAIEPVVGREFMRHNPNKIRQVKGGPVRTMPLNLSVPPGEEKLKAMLNVTLQTLLDIGFVDRALKASPDYDATILRISPPYKIQSR